MVKVLHFADTHLGMENYGRLDPVTGLSSRIHDFARRMDEVVTFARENGVELAIFAGDAFKNRQPNPTIQREFAYRIRELAELCPVILLVGNHDLPSNVERASSIEIYETLSVPNVRIGRDFEIFNVETRGGVVQVATAPYPIRAQLIDAEETAGMSLKAVEDHMQGRLIQKLNGLTRAAAQSDAPRLLVGHFSIAEAKPSSERGLMLGRDLAVPLSEIADPVWDYVAMGHIHKYQNVTDDRPGVPPVVYSGSLECIDFGEEHDHKGFCWIELERGNTSYEFIPVAARRFKTIDIDVRGLVNPMPEIYKEIDALNLTEAIVRVIIQCDEDDQDKIDERAIMAHLFQQAKVNYVAAVEKRIERAARTRLGTDPEQLSDWQLLEGYFKAKDTSADQLPDLMDYAHKLLDGSDDIS